MKATIFNVQRQWQAAIANHPVKKPVTSTEPIGLRQWEPSDARQRGEGHLFSCGRPGRATFKTEMVAVDETVIDLWTDGLPREEPLHIASLLGKKRDGQSEFWYYPFRSEFESNDKPTFQSWLNSRYGKRYIVHEFPTTDRRGVSAETIDEIRTEIAPLLQTGLTVLVVDSAGAERTARVCEALGYKKGH